MLRQSVANDLILDVRDIHDMVEAVPARAQPSPQQVVKRKCAEVAHVRVIVYCRAARVHADDFVLLRLEFLYLLRERIIEAQRHIGDLFIVASSTAPNGFSKPRARFRLC